MKSLLDQLFDQSRPTTRGGVWELCAEDENEALVVPFTTHRSAVLAVDQARVEGVPREGLEALNLVGLYVDDRRWTWRLRQLINARGERHE